MQRSLLTDRFRSDGARLAETPDGPVLLTYGDVPAEYEAAREKAVVFDATPRGALCVTGAERAEFLHRILANEVRHLAPGRGNANLLLTSKGKVAQAFELLVDEEEIRLEAPAARIPALAAEVDRYLFAEDVQLEDVSESVAPVEICGPEAAALVSSVLGLELPTWEAGTWLRTDWEGAPLRVAAWPVAGSPGYRLDAGPAAADALWQRFLAAGARPAGVAVSDILRIEAGQAVFGADVDDNIYPQEARLESAFSLEKGCYIGQEVVAKIDTYGGLNKRLVCLRFDHDDPVPRGTELSVVEDGEARNLGLVTSWSYSFVLDTGIALAYVKRKHQAVGKEFELVGAPGKATVVEMPVRPGALPITGEFE